MTTRAMSDLTVDTTGPFPIIEGSVEMLAQLASATLAAIKHSEAAVMKNKKPVIGVMLLSAPGCPCVGTPDEEDCPHE